MSPRRLLRRGCSPVDHAAVKILALNPGMVRGADSIDDTPRTTRSCTCPQLAWQDRLDKLFRQARDTKDRRWIEAETTEIIPVLRERLTGGGVTSGGLPELSCSAGGGLADVGDDGAGDLAQLDIAVL